MSPNEADSYDTEESGTATSIAQQRHQAVQNAARFGIQHISSQDREQLSMAVLPSPAHIKKAMQHLDLAIKLEMLLYELSSSLYWGSLAELSACYKTTDSTPSKAVPAEAHSGLKNSIFRLRRARLSRVLGTQGKQETRGERAQPKRTPELFVRPGVRRVCL